MMTDNELDEMRLTLELKAQKIAGKNPWSAAEEMMTAGMMTAEITSELARREIIRSLKKEE